MTPVEIELLLTPAIPDVGRVECRHSARLARMADAPWEAWEVLHLELLDPRRIIRSRPCPLTRIDAGKVPQPRSDGGVWVGLGLRGRVVALGCPPLEMIDPASRTVMAAGNSSRAFVDNIDVFEGADVPLPETWDDIIDHPEIYGPDGPIDIEGGIVDVLDGLELSVVQWEDLLQQSEWIEEIFKGAGFPQTSG